MTEPTNGATITSLHRRRLVWIVRYCPTGTRIIPGIRGAFDETYPLVPVMGDGVQRQQQPMEEGEGEGHARRERWKLQKIYLDGKGDNDGVDEAIYAPCFGNLVDLLKK